MKHNGPYIIYQYVKHYIVHLNVYIFINLQNTLVRLCIIKNVSSSTSHKKNSVFMSLRLYVREFNSLGAEASFWVNPTLPLMLSPNYVSGSQPDSNKREGDVRFPLLFFLTQIFLKINHELMLWRDFAIF